MKIVHKNHILGGKCLTVSIGLKCSHLLYKKKTKNALHIGLNFYYHMYLSGYECIIEHCRSLGMFAYEDAVNGILVKYLQKFIVQDKSVIEIFSQVQEG